MEERSATRPTDAGAARFQEAGFELRRLRPSDAAALAAFYNALGPDSKRTFRPLGPVTTVAACEAVIRHNALDSGEKLDLVFRRSGDGSCVIHHAGYALIVSDGHLERVAREFLGAGGA